MLSGESADEPAFRDVVRSVLADVLGARGGDEIGGGVAGEGWAPALKLEEVERRVLGGGTGSGVVRIGGGEEEEEEGDATDGLWASALGAARVGAVGRRVERRSSIDRKERIADRARRLVRKGLEWLESPDGASEEKENSEVSDGQVGGVEAEERNGLELR